MKDAVSKANSMLGMLKRTFTYFDDEIYLILYKTFIRPHLEFAISVWSPYLKSDIKIIENL